MANRTADDYIDLLKKLLPPGPAWRDHAIGPFLRLSQALANALAQLDTTAEASCDEMDPLTLLQTIPDWERVLKLPNGCLGPDQTLAQRQAMVRSRLTDTDSVTPAYFLKLAHEQGYVNATIIEHRAPRMGRARFGSSHFGSRQAAFIWTLNLGKRKVGGRHFGASQWGERFGQNPSVGTECLINQAKPPHTVIIFNYGE